MRGLLESPVASGEHDCPEARERRQKSKARLVKIGEPSPQQTAHTRIYLGGESAIGEQAARLYLTEAEGKAFLWVEADLRDHPCLHHYQGRIGGSCFTTRVHLGVMGARSGDSYLLRCAADKDGCHHACLPTEPESDEFVIFYRLQTPEQWARELGGDCIKLEVDDPETYGEWLAPKVAAGWERYDDYRTGAIWLRAPNQTIEAVVAVEISP